MSKQFKVIRIINEQRIVLNAGKRDNINEDTMFEIIGFSKPLIDPDTGEDLGTMEILKAKVSILDLKEKFCICQNALVRDFSLQVSATIGDLLNPATPTRAPLKVDALEMMDIMSSQESAIRVGDLARIAE